MIARKIDDVRSSLAVVQRRAVLSFTDSRDLKLARDALLYYRMQRCPGVAALDTPDPISNMSGLLERAARGLESLSELTDNNLPQRKMLRGCLEKVRRVRANLEKIQVANLRFDWRSAQLPRGDAA